MLVVSFALAILGAFPASAFAQQPSILVPLAGSTPTIDGVWTSPSEWSKASETVANYTDGTRLVIRTMRDADTFYVLLEMPKDYVVDGHGAICFDTLSDGGPYMNTDDYCYLLGEVLREYHGNGRTTLMQQAALTPGIRGERGLSGTDSPYHSARDHVTYEFSVDIGRIGDETTHYGFYVTYDTRGQTSNASYFYSWPVSESAAYLRVISPRSWGLITTVESDLAVPEFPLPILGAIGGIIAMLAMMNRMKFLKP
jgi:hypothetical protein